MTKKYSKMLEDDDVRRWYENLAAKSKITANVYLRTLGLFYELTELILRLCLRLQKPRLSGITSWILLGN